MMEDPMHGIGKETAKELARRNARVILACRDTSRAAAAAREIYRETGREVVLRRLDLCSFKSIREFADDIIAGEERLDVLINNAGIVPFPERVETVDGFEQTFQTNHLGPFLLTNLLLGKLKASAPSRIITLSSLLHHFGRVDPSRLEYSDYKVPMQVYSDTKLANILFTKELARRLQGTVQTDINSTYVGFLNIFMNGLFYFFGKSPAEGAQTSIFLAVSDEVRKVSGKYFMDCRLSVPSRTSEDAELARKLWAVSEKMTGLAI
ncbi:retinol dehydrogenase 11-like isoform X1 [Ixodes scapularis]